MSDKFVVDFDKFRFYEDGTESGSSAIEAEDTNLTGRDVSSDSQVHLRCRVQEIGAGIVAGETTDDYTLEYRLNGGGSWIPITTTSNRVQCDPSSSLTDDGATTNRSTDGITDGSGSFFAGIQEEGDGEITDFQHEADNFTEHVFALLLVSADFTNSDFVDFRLRLNGGAMDNSVTPRITVSKGAADFPVDVAPGAYSITGDPDTAPLLGAMINAGPDSYALSGVSATPLRDAMINAAPDSYAISGVDTSLLRGLFLNAIPGDYFVGNNKTVNGRFHVDTDWNKTDPAVTISGGELHFSGAQVTTINANQDMGLTIGIRYRTIFTITGMGAGLCQLACGSATAGTVRNSPGTYIEELICTGNSTGYIWGDADFDGDVDIVSFEELIDANLLVARGINASPATYTITGVDTTLLRDALLSLDSGGYSISGQAATLAFGYVIITDTGAYLITGVDVTALVERGLNASPGVYVISGIDGSLLAGRLLSVDPSSYSLSGIAAILAKGFAFITDPGVYSISGVNMIPLADRILSATPGFYFTGGPNFIVGGQDMADAAWADYLTPTTNEQTTHDGQVNCRYIIGDNQYDGFKNRDNIIYQWATVLGKKYRVRFKAKVISNQLYVDVFDGGASFNTLVTNLTPATWTEYAYTYVETVGGSDIYMRFMQGAGGVGEFYIDEVTVEELIDAELLVGRVLNGAPASYSIAGQSASLIAGYLMVTDVGSYLVTGSDAALVVDYIINGAPGVYGITGIDATLQGPIAADYPINLEPGIYALAGGPGGLLADRLLLAAPGAYIVLGSGAILEKVYLEELIVFYRNRPLTIIGGNIPFDVIYRGKPKKVMG